ncbi:MAG TPA: recombination regulator RecX [Candidatus Pygmaiobacter gallistercoris]|nr:recombination regulator RecX [Candidatus Pygmaiobacter gallistercoris]
MLLTAVETTRRGRCALFGDGEFLFSVDPETFAKSGLAEGDTLEEETLARLREQSDLRAAKDRALLLLSGRDHGAQELFQKLCRSFDDHTAAAAVAEMQRLGLLDDAAFARRKAESLAAKHKSRREIAAKLASIGIDRPLIEQALSSIAQEDETETIRPLLERQYRSKLAAGGREKVLAALVRRGFRTRDAIAAVDRFLEENFSE